MIEPYQAVVLQCSEQEAEVHNSRQVIRDNIWRQIVLLRRFKFSYGRMRLVVLPELCTHGLDISGDNAKRGAMALSLPVDRPLWECEGAEEMAMYGLAAREFNIYICGSTNELDPQWPDTTFQTGFIISPEGKIILKQRMINVQLGAGVAGFYQRLLDHYGEDSPYGPFPVVDTDIGRLAVNIGGDLTAFEHCRVLAMRGAEVILHTMGERNMENSHVIAAAKRLAAQYYHAYFVSANIGQYMHNNFREPAPPTNDNLRETLPKLLNWGEFEFMGRSQIIGPDGQMLAFIPAAGESATGAVIDVERLRHDRQSGAFGRIPYGEVYANEYQRFGGAEINWFGSGSTRIQRTRKMLMELIERGVLTPSELYGGDVGGGHFAELPAVLAAAAAAAQG